MTEKQKREAADEARERLLGSGVFRRGMKPLLIVVKSVSASGMYRRMMVYTGDGSGDLTRWIAPLCDLPINDRGLGVGGCGMDMTFWLADHITSCLWPEPKARPKWLKGNGGGCLEWTTL